MAATDTNSPQPMTIAGTIAIFAVFLLTVILLFLNRENPDYRIFLTLMVVILGLAGFSSGMKLLSLYDEQAIELKRKASTVVPRFQSCPDYYTRLSNGATASCSQLVSQDSEKMIFIGKPQPPLNTEKGLSGSFDGSAGRIQLNALNAKTQADRCKDATAFAWTEARNACTGAGVAYD